MGVDAGVLIDGTDVAGLMDDSMLTDVGVITLSFFAFFDLCL